MSTDPLPRAEMLRAAGHNEAADMLDDLDKFEASRPAPEAKATEPEGNETTDMNALIRGFGRGDA